MNNASPWNTAFEMPRKGLIRQELVTYEVGSDGQLHRKIVVRTFTETDYTDTMTATPLLSLKGI